MANRQTISFLHDSLRDYFAAEKLQSEGDTAKPYYFLPRFEPVIPLLAGLLENADALLHTILVEPDDIFHSTLLLAGRCITVVYVQKTPKQAEILEQLEGLLDCPYDMIVEKVVQILMDIDTAFSDHIMSTTLTRAQISCARKLINLEDDTVLLKVISLLSEKHVHTEVKSAIIDGLRHETLGNSVCHQLLSLLEEEEIDINIRVQIVESFGYRLTNNPRFLTRLLNLISKKDVNPRLRHHIVTSLGSSSKYDSRIHSQLFALLSESHIEDEIKVNIAKYVDSDGNHLSPSLREKLNYEQMMDDYEAAMNDWEEYKFGERLRLSYNTDWIWAFASRDPEGLAFWLLEQIEEIVNEEPYWYESPFCKNSLPFVDTLRAITHYAEDEKPIPPLFKLLKLSEAKQLEFDFSHLSPEPVYKAIYDIARRVNVRVLNSGALYSLDDFRRDHNKRASENDTGV